MNTSPMPPATEDVLASWQRLTAANPRLRERDAARMLGLPEVALVRSLPAPTAIRLGNDWKALFEGIESIGRVTAITRNESAIHEKHGVYRNVEMGKMQGVVHDKDIDLRFFPSVFTEAWAVTKTTAHGVRHSIQIFDDRGEAAHKIWCTEQSDMAAFDALVTRLAAPADLPLATLAEITPTPEPTLPANLDVAGFQAAWMGLKDTHGFYPLLRKFGVDRMQALTIAPQGMATQVPVDALERALTIAAKEAVSIMVFIGNRAAIQIHTGPIENVSGSGQWLNVLDEGFNLHLRRDRIASTWLVIKPTEDGPVHSLELFDTDREMFVQVFGERKPGIPESPQWVDILKRVSVPTPA